jgi:2-keto-4-pentenoate hydratase/2-oxohepta-3-ene-1,7-dioic acid hydratase in catechol pathway
MRLVTFRHSRVDGARIGVVAGDEIVDLATASPALPAEMSALLAAGDAALAAARDAASRGTARVPLAEATLEAPILRPPKFLALGLNYADHIAEAGLPAPPFPVFFNKQSTCVTGPHAPIWMPRISTALDYEGELGFVVGKRCRYVPRERAHEVIAGYLVVNDVTIRDWQFKSPTWTLGKSCDTHGPIGPWITTPDEVGDPHALGIRTWVNGELRQDSNTKHFIFDCFAQVEILSQAMTLEPGDIVTTGTPGGVGVARKPPQMLKLGDRVRVEIEKIGAIESEVVPEPAAIAYC